MSNIKKLLLASFFLATSIVLSRFLSIKTPILTISFSFVPLMLCAMLLDFKWAMLVGTLSDLIGALLFPFGAYFFGYTLSACLSGLIYGLLINITNKNWSNKKLIIRLLISSLLVSFLINGCINTLWIYLTTKSAFKVIVPVRIAKQLIMVPIKIIVMYALYKIIPVKKLYLTNSNIDQTTIVEIKGDNLKSTKKTTSLNGNKDKDVNNDKIASNDRVVKEVVGDTEKNKINKDNTND